MDKARRNCLSRALSLRIGISADFAALQSLRWRWHGQTTLYSMAEQCARYTVEYDDEEALKNILQQALSRASKDYGKPFLQIFKEADRDFYKIDLNLFAPAVFIINNVKTGRTLQAGQLNIEALKESFSLS